MRLAVPLVATLLCACQGSLQPPVAVVAHVDLQRFMGAWYVIANIPTFIEKSAYNAIESYRLDTDGSIETNFTFRAGRFDGPAKTYRPRGFVLDKCSNAIWGMRFVWPIKADYRILYLRDDYQLTVVGRQQRDYVWVMARTPSISATDYAQVMKLIAANGYDTSRIRRVPQQWGVAP